MGLNQRSLDTAREGLKELRPLFARLSVGEYAMSEPYRKEPVQVVVYRPDGRSWKVAVKVEEEYTGNLYLEVWSDLHKVSGWMRTLKDDGFDLLVYYFRHRKEYPAGVTYAIPVRRLHRWFFEDGNKDKYPAKVPKLNQKNTTVGHTVPVSALRSIEGFREFRGPAFGPPPPGPPRMGD